MPPAPTLAIPPPPRCGAVLRWSLGTRLDSLFPDIPPGPLTANLIGGYIIGLAVACFAQAPDIAPEWRLAVIIGVCGGLTTFFTFSAEMVTLWRQGSATRATSVIAIHVDGSLPMTLAALACWQLLKPA